VWDGVVTDFFIRLNYVKAVYKFWPGAMETCKCMAAFLVSFQSVEVLDLYIFVLTFSIIPSHVLNKTLSRPVRDFTLCAFVLELLG
jgi:hypothetical protein